MTDQEREKQAAKPGPAEEADAAEAKEEMAKEEAAERAEAAEDDADEKQAEAATGQRRSADAVATTRKKPPRRTADGRVVVHARARYVRCAPRKARLVIDHIRGKSVDEARAILRHTPRAASRDVLKVLESAIANAESSHELTADELTVAQAYVDEGPTIKRYQPRALGRATRIRKRTSHMTIALTPKEGS
jgi:large subunit ribosomal protein L22